MGGVDLRGQRHLYNGFGNALSRAFELVVTPLVFALAGWFVDRWLDTSPTFVLVLGGFGFAGVCARTYFQYVDAMAAHDAELPSRRTGPGPVGR
ncbi:MAG: AtpZ/AtpI family protein [Acidimicrobiia bacterium]